MATKKSVKKSAKKDKVKFSFEAPCSKEDMKKFKESKISCHTNKSCGGAIYGFGFVGAAIYYISTATTFWIGVLGLLKAIVWPAFLVFELLKYLGA